MSLATLPATRPSVDAPRSLHNELLRMQRQAASYTEELVDEARGLWACTAVSDGISARAVGQGKKQAKRAAAEALLTALKNTNS